MLSQYFVDINSDSVISFLQDNPALLDNYIQNYVSEDVVESWLTSKRKAARARLKNGELIYSKAS